jgi:hypothetical protein
MNWTNGLAMFSTPQSHHWSLMGSFWYFSTKFVWKSHCFS